jgi:hypothetical protein
VIGTNAGTFGATVGLTRYIDPGQVIQQHTITPVALVSGSNAVTFNDDLPYIGFTFYIQNTGTGIMTVTALGILFSSV